MKEELEESKEGTVLFKVTKTDIGIRVEGHTRNEMDFIDIGMSMIHFMRQNPFVLLVIKTALEKAEESGQLPYSELDINDIPDFNEVLKNAKINPNDHIKES